MITRRADRIRQRTAELHQEAAEIARDIEEAEQTLLGGQGTTREDIAKVREQLDASEAAALRELLRYGPVKQARHGNRKDAVLFNPLVKQKLVSVEYEGATRTWDLTPLGRLVAEEDPS